MPVVSICLALLANALASPNPSIRMSERVTMVAVRLNLVDRRNAYTVLNRVLAPRHNP